MRAPEAPIGWPSAIAPPWILTFSASMPVSFSTAMDWTAKASFNSKRSTASNGVSVVFKSLPMAADGADAHNGRVYTDRGKTGTGGQRGQIVLADERFRLPGSMPRHRH